MSAIGKEEVSGSPFEGYWSYVCREVKLLWMHCKQLMVCAWLVVGSGLCVLGRYLADVLQTNPYTCHPLLFWSWTEIHY